MHEIHDHIYFLNVQEVLDEVNEIIYEIQLDRDDHRDCHERICHAMYEFLLVLNLFSKKKLQLYRKYFLQELR